jgi:hypothetical protein
MRDCDVAKVQQGRRGYDPVPMTSRSGDKLLSFRSMVYPMGPVARSSSYTLCGYLPVRRILRNIDSLSLVILSCYKYKDNIILTIGRTLLNLLLFRIEVLIYIHEYSTR